MGDVTLGFSGVGTISSEVSFSPFVYRDGHRDFSLSPLLNKLMRVKTIHSHSLKLAPDSSELAVLTHKPP